MGFISEANFTRIVSVPMSVPQTELPAGSVVTVATVLLHADQTLRARWLSLFVPKINKAPGSVERVTDYYEAVYVGLYSGKTNDDLRALGMPLLWVGLDGCGYAELDFARYTDFSSPGQYTLALINNTSSHDYDAVVTGAFRIF